MTELAIHKQTAAFNIHGHGEVTTAKVDIGIALIRVVACFMVVMLHVAASGFNVFDGAWWPSNFYDAVTRTCVPLFLMVTGALLLNRQETLASLLRRRFARLLPPLLFWSLFYVAWRAWRSGGSLDWLAELTSLVSQPASYHLWYLYAMLGITLFLPFLRLLWRHASEAEKRFYLLMWLVISGLPMWESVLGWEADPIIVYELSNFFGLAGYLFFGAWLQDIRNKTSFQAKTYISSLTLFGLGSVATMMATAWLSQLRGVPSTLFYDYLSPFVILAAGGAYLCLAWSADKLLCNGLSSRLQQAILAISALTLGIYCIHISWLEWFMDYVDWRELGVAAWWMMPLVALCLFVLSALSIAMLRTVRLLRYVL